MSRKLTITLLSTGSLALLTLILAGTLYFLKIFDGGTLQSALLILMPILGLFAGGSFVLVLAGGAVSSEQTRADRGGADA